MNQKRINNKINFQISFILFVVLNFISCNSNSNHAIEIYLLKERIGSKDGIAISDIKNLKDLDTSNLKSISKIARYDTINKEFIYAGKFNVSQNQIDTSPLIKDSE